VGVANLGTCWCLPFSAALATFPGRFCPRRPRRVPEDQSQWESPPTLACPTAFRHFALLSPSQAGHKLRHASLCTALDNWINARASRRMHHPSPSQAAQALLPRGVLPRLPCPTRAAPVPQTARGSCPSRSRGLRFMLIRSFHPPSCPRVHSRKTVSQGAGRGTWGIPRTPQHRNYAALRGGELYISQGAESRTPRVAACDRVAVPISRRCVVAQKYFSQHVARSPQIEPKACAPAVSEARALTLFGENDKLSTERNRSSAGASSHTFRATVPPRHRANAPMRHRATAPPRHRATAPLHHCAAAPPRRRTAVRRDVGKERNVAPHPQAASFPTPQIAVPFLAKPP